MIVIIGMMLILALFHSRRMLSPEQGAFGGSSQRRIKRDYFLDFDHFLRGKS